MTNHTDRDESAKNNLGRPFSEMRSTGMLWLINRLLHTWGYALGIHVDDDGNATGWEVHGDGSEPWKFGDSVPEDELFSQVMALFEETRNESS